MRSGAALVAARLIAGASSLARFGVEAALQLGPVRIQTKYIENEVGRDLLRFGTLDRNARPFDGGYIQALIALDGPPRIYRLVPNYGTHFDVSRPTANGGPVVVDLTEMRLQYYLTHRTGAPQAARRRSG